MKVNLSGANEVVYAPALPEETRKEPAPNVIMVKAIEPQESKTEANIKKFLTYGSAALLAIKLLKL